MHPPWRQGINAGAEVLEAVQAGVDLARILGIRAFSLERVLAEEPAFLEVRERASELGA